MDGFGDARTGGNNEQHVIQGVWSMLYDRHRVHVANTRLCLRDG